MVLSTVGALPSAASIGLPEATRPQAGVWPARQQAICYVRADTPTLAQPLTVEVDRCAVAHDHTVIAWFRDSLTEARSGRRPGFAHCLRALSAGIATTLIVPTVEHLAPPGRLRQWLVTEIHTFGGLLLVVSPDPTPDPALAPAAVCASQAYFAGPI